MVEKFECKFVKCLNPMCSAVVYTGCISYKKVPVVADLRDFFKFSALLTMS